MSRTGLRLRLGVSPARWRTQPGPRLSIAKRCGVGPPSPRWGPARSIAKRCGGRGGGMGAEPPSKGDATMKKHQKIKTFLWFDGNAEEAVEHYVSLFPDSRVTKVSRWGKGGPQPEGSVLTVAFELAGQAFVALNGGPQYK